MSGLSRLSGCALGDGFTITFEVGRVRLQVGCRKLHAPASGRLVGSERHMGRICLGLAAAQAGRVITGSGNNHEDGTGWNSR